MQRALELLWILGFVFVYHSFIQFSLVFHFVHKSVKNCEYSKLASTIRSFRLLEIISYLFFHKYLNLEEEKFLKMKSRSKRLLRINNKKNHSDAVLINFLFGTLSHLFFICLYNVKIYQLRMLLLFLYLQKLL